MLVHLSAAYQHTRVPFPVIFGSFPNQLPTVISTSPKSGRSTNKEVELRKGVTGKMSAEQENSEYDDVVYTKGHTMLA
jgi:hypothetical protein